MDLDGVVGHVVQGTKILLQCTVRAARPPANVTWQNGTQFLSKSSERLEMFKTKIDDNVSKRAAILYLRLMQVKPLLPPQFAANFPVAIGITVFSCLLLYSRDIIYILVRLFTSHVKSLNRAHFCMQRVVHEYR